MARALIAPGIVIEIQLMILLCIPPLSRRQDLGCNAVLPPLLVRLLRDLFCRLLLFRVVVEDGAAVLRAAVGALLVLRGWVVHFIEEFEEGTVGNLVRVVYNLQCLSVTCSSTTHSPVPWVLYISSNVSHPCIIQPLVFELPSVHVLNTPEAARCHRGSLRPCGNRHGLCGCGRHGCEGA